MKVTQTDWIVAAVHAIAKHGVDAVKVERLAREIGVSKGSFYWYFKNRSELLEATLAFWEKETETLIEMANQVDGPPLAKLRGLFSAIGELADQMGGYAIDTAVFSWSLRDPAVAERVRRVEEKRVAYLTDLFIEEGHSAEQARFQAEAMYFAFLGFIDRSNREPSLRSPEAFRKIITYLMDRLIIQPQEGES